VLEVLKITMCKTYYTYIIYAASDDKYYVGSTHDLKLRLKHHNDGWTKSTKHGIPWKLVYSEQYSSKSDAIRREYQIKKMKSRKYIEDLLK
jgi:putative endonuclease